MEMANKIYAKIEFLMVGFTRPIFSMFFLYIAYLLFGSMCFVSLETTYEENTHKKSLETIRLAKSMVEALRKENYSDNDIFFTFSNQKERLKKSANSLNWVKQYVDKMFFAFILLSTVGFGNVAPTSRVGQVACIFYSAFGVSLHVVMMRLLGFKFRGGLRKLYKVAQKCAPTSGFALAVASVLFFAFWLSVFIFLPTYVFTISEDWDFIRGFYFSFVSLTTIGLGDFVAGVSPKHVAEELYILEIIVMIIWMFFGLCFFSMAANEMSNIVGVALLDKLDCKCEKRSSAKIRLQRLLELIKDLNWQLVKYKPENFRQETDIEDFKALLTENPQDVNDEMLLKIFKIVTDLREHTYDQLAGLMVTELPMTTVLQQARDDLPEVISSCPSLGSSTTESRTTSVPDVPASAGNETIKSVPELGSDVESARQAALPFSQSHVIVPMSSNIDLEEARRRLMEDKDTITKMMERWDLNKENDEVDQNTDVNQDADVAEESPEAKDTSEEQHEEKKKDDTSEEQHEEKNKDDTSEEQPEEKKKDDTSEEQHEEKKKDDTSEEQHEEKTKDDTSEGQHEEKTKDDTSEEQHEEKKKDDAS